MSDVDPFQFADQALFGQIPPAQQTEVQDPEPLPAAGGNAGGTYLLSTQALGDIYMPIKGMDPSDLSNNFGHEREGGARSHAGIDLGFGFPHGTPVYAPVSGYIRYRMRRSPDGGARGYGVAVSIIDAAGNYHNLAHLAESTLQLGVLDEDNQASQADRRIEAGQLVGFLGKTGNAWNTPVHLHYGINEGRSDRPLINPYELLANGAVQPEGEHIPHDLEYGDFFDADVAEEIPDTLEELSPERRAEVMERFGHWTLWLEDPEWGPILIEAAVRNWSQERFQDAISQTDRWRSMSDTARAWEQVIVTDPATANQHRQNAMGFISDTARTLGLRLSDEALGQLAEDALTFGWINAETGAMSSLMTDAIVMQGMADKAGGNGLIGTIDVEAQEIQEEAAKYFLSVTPSVAEDVARSISLGETTLAAVKEKLRRDAAEQFPFFKGQLDQGFTLAQLFDSRRQRVASLLEIDPEEVDFLNDSRFSHLVEFAEVDGGGYRPANFAELGDYVRGLPEFDRTDQALSSAASLGEEISRRFGKVR